MGWKGKAMSEVGQALGRKIFGETIPETVQPMFKEGVGGISKVDADIFSKAIDFDPEVREPLDALFRKASGGDDNAYMLLENAAKDFATEDQALRVKSKAQKNFTQQQGIVPQKPKKAYQLSDDVEDFMGDTDLETARSWEDTGGELDQALQDMLTVKKKTTITTPEGKKVTLNKGDMMTPDMLTGSKKDYYNSLIATGFKTAPDDELVYGFGGQELSKMAGLEGKDPGFSPQLHKGKSFHHKSMKEIQSSIHKRARELRESGEATTDDLINLHALSNSMGAPSGSRKSAGMWLEEFGHNITHKQTAQRKGIEPTTTRWTNEFRGEGKPKQVPTKLWNPAKKAADDLGVKLTPFDIDYIKRQGDPLESAIAKWKVFRKTKMYDALKPDGQSEMSRLVKSTENMSIAELTQFQKEMLEDITKPMTEEMVLMEEVMDSFTPQELLELMKQKDWQTPLNLRRALKEKKAAMVEAKSDKAIRKQMNAIPDEYWNSKSK